MGPSLVLDELSGRCSALVSGTERKQKGEEMSVKD